MFWPLRLVLALTVVIAVAVFSASDSKPVEAQSPGDTVSVSNLDRKGGLGTEVGHTSGNLNQAATAFTTGGAAGGYTLGSVTAAFAHKLGNPGNIVVAIHANSGGNPASSATITLSGSNPGSPGDYTFTCSTNCNLERNTTYFLVLSAPNASNNGRYSWFVTSSDTQTNVPTEAGWQIADVGKSKSGAGNWLNLASGFSGVFKVTATVNTPKTLSFGNNTAPNQPYPKDTAITTLTLPAATPSTGSPSIAYGLDCGTPDVPDGLTYANRQLSGTPTTLGSASCTYTASATGYTSATQSFNIVVYDPSQVTPARPAAPAKPTLTAGVGSITVNWNEPADNGNAAITDYDIQYCWWTWEDVDYCKNVANWRNWPHTGTATTATLTALYGSATHLVKVRAVNSEGPSEWSQYNWIKPLVGELKAPPNLRVTAMEHENGDWLKADWDWPNWSGSRVWEWHIKYRYCKVCDSNSPDWSEWEHQYDKGDGFSDANIYNVAAGVRYEVQVRGRNNAGWGAWSSPGYADTRAGGRGQTVAPPPSDLTFTNVTVSGTTVTIHGSGKDTWWYDYRSSRTGDWYGCTYVKGFGKSGVHTVTIKTPGEYRFEISAPDCGRGGDYFAAQYLTIAAPPPPVGQSIQPTPTPTAADDDDSYSCSYPVDLPGHPCHGIYVP